VRYRTAFALLLAYWSLFCRVFEDSGKVGAVGPAPLPTQLPSGITFLDTDGEVPLTRESVLARAKLANKDNMVKKRMMVGRVTKKRLAKEEAEQGSQDDDSLAVLENALRVAAGESEPRRRAHMLKEAYAALANIHSARGQYHEMLHSMILALDASEGAGDKQGSFNLYVALGHLELSHHRYYAAGTRFQDALSSGVCFRRCTEALAGLGWATLLQGDVEVARGRFLEALGWATGTPYPSAQEIVAKDGCKAHADGFDGTRTVALAGLSLVSTRTSNHRDPSASLVDCAVSIFQSVPADFQEPLVWVALGLARHAHSHTAAANRYHRRAALHQRRDPSLVGSREQTLESRACDTAADLPSCSHIALHLSLVHFSTGDISAGARHVESIVSRAGGISVEVVEWLTRFARANAWTPAGHAFAVFLFSHFEALLANEGAARMAQYFADYGRLLLLKRDNAANIKSGLFQLSRALEIIETAKVRWPESEIASLYSTMGAAQHHLGEIEQAVHSFEKALAYDKTSGVDGKPNFKRMLWSYASLGAARLEVAGSDAHHWQLALEDFKAGRQAALQAGLSSTDPVMKQFEASYRNARLLAIHRGMLHSCPGPLDALLYGLSCSTEADMAPI
jgi:tetratricopeptide (TPR) repeat protein